MRATPLIEHWHVGACFSLTLPSAAATPGTRPPPPPPPQRRPHHLLTPPPASLLLRQPPPVLWDCEHTLAGKPTTVLDDLERIFSSLLKTYRFMSPYLFIPNTLV